MTTELHRLTCKYGMQPASHRVFKLGNRWFVRHFRDDSTVGFTFKTKQAAVEFAKRNATAVLEAERETSNAYATGRS